MSWRAVYCLQRCELFARDNLVAAGIEVFLPFERVTRRRKIRGQSAYRDVTVDEPIYPRYMFAFSYDVKPILDARGVADVVRRGCTPVQVPERIVARLRKMADAEGCVDKRDITKPSFHFKGKVGDQFEFARGSGPLAGFQAVIASLESLDDDGEISAFVDLLGKSHMVKVPWTGVGRVLTQMAA